MAAGPHLLIIDANYYTDISNALKEGAVAEIEKAGGSFEYLSVPGVLEIPAALAMAVGAVKAGRANYDGYVLLGCVIRGETTHYEIVSNESARAIMDISINECIAVGNGIQTVENEDQAWARAKLGDKNKGGGAATAAIAMIAVAKKYS